MAQSRQAILSMDVYGNVHLNLDQQLPMLATTADSAPFMLLHVKEPNGRTRHKMNYLLHQFDAMHSTLQDRDASIFYPLKNSRNWRSFQPLHDSLAKKQTIRKTYFEAGPICSNGGWYEIREYEDWVYGRNQKLKEVIAGEYGKTSPVEYSPYSYSNYYHFLNTSIKRVKRVTYEGEIKPSYIRQKNYNGSGKLQTEILKTTSNFWISQLEINKVMKGLSVTSNPEKYLRSNDVYSLHIYYYGKNGLDSIHEHSLNSYASYEKKSYRFTYNEKGKLKSYLEYPHFYSSSLKIDFEYNEDGKVIRKTENPHYGCDACTKNAQILTYSYDKNGRINKVIYDYEDDDLVPFERFEYIYHGVAHE
jgi:hypothetical protein